MNSLKVALGPRSYDIIVKPGVIIDAGQRIQQLLTRKHVVIITDTNVARLHLETLKKSLDKTGIDHSTIILEAGEKTKDFAHLQELTNKLLDTGVERATTLIALGGGVIGDISGFAAAITLRGLAFIQIPTTLLAQVDSSVGGKTGINTHQGKNLIGAFHQPSLVLSDIAVLDTLPRRDLLSGYGEMVKYGLINNGDFFSWLEKNATAMLDNNHDALQQAVITSCAAKAAIVADDEREGGKRALLNLGHTFGHALEAETGYSSTLTHGEAVAIGICLAFDLSARLGLCPDADAERVRQHIKAVGLPDSLDDIASPSWSADHLMRHMRRDKKTKDGKPTFILARGIGKSFISLDVNMDDVRRLLHDALS